MNSDGPAKVRLSPTTTFLMPNCTTAPGAKVARHQNRTENGALEDTDPSGLTETVYYGMGHRVIFLHPFIVPDCD